MRKSLSLWAVLVLGVVLAFLCGCRTPEPQDDDLGTKPPLAVDPESGAK